MDVETKNINDLDSNDSVNNSDNLMVGNAGTNTLRRVKLSTLFDSIKSLITSWTFSALNTSSKYLTGAINEVLSSLNTLTTRVSRRTSGYTGNIDDLHGIDNAGGYWCNPDNCTGTLPFSTWFNLDVFLSNSGNVQRAVNYRTGEVKFRSYTNSQWYDWTGDMLSADSFSISNLSESSVSCDSGSTVTVTLNATRSGYRLIAAWPRVSSYARMHCVGCAVNTSENTVTLTMYVSSSDSSVTRAEVNAQALYVKE